MLLKGIQARLLVTLLLASILPLAVGGIVFFSLVKENITVETFQRVSFARDSKSSEIRQYLAFARRQAESFSQSANLRYSVGDFYGFSYALRQISVDPEEAAETLREIFDNTPEEQQNGQLSPSAQDQMLRDAIEYANAHRRFHTGFQEFLARAEFDNLYLVDRRGQIVYSVRHDPYFGRFLSSDESELAQIYNTLNSQEQDMVFADFKFDPVTQQVAAHLAVKISLYGRSSATLVLRLPASGLQELLAASDVITLVSSDNRVIASPANTGLVPGSQLTLPVAMQELAGIQTFSAGLSGAPTLSAWNRLKAPLPDWLIVAEISQAEAFATSRELRSAFLFIGLLAAAILAPIAFALSRSVTGPIRRLALAAGAIADGALDHELPEYDRPQEYASLSKAVSQMRRSLRDQLELIRTKNSELQIHLRQIEDKNTALQEADRMKDQFLANTSHELRTPLNGIIGISETLETGLMGQVEPGQRSQLRLISFSARRLSRLVDDLLDIYRIREGQIRLDPQAVDVVHSLHNVLQLAQPLLHEDPATINIEAPDDLAPVLADPMRFEQILFNLVSNAIRHSRQSEVFVSAKIVGKTIAVSVRDQGPGIAPDSLERIFHPLEQITSVVSRTGKHEGTGLGLTIARNLAELMSGEISVRSELGKGSEFTLSLPAAKTPAVVVDTKPMLAPPTIQNGTQLLSAAPDAPQKADAPYILLVDDEPINLQVLRNVLSPQGYLVTDCSNGPDAIVAISAKKPDIVILDVMMSGMSGLDVARKLRRGYSLLDLPIILLTARGRTSDMIEGFEVGANDYVVKPFVKDELLSRIRTLLQASRAKRHASENTELRDEIERRIQVEDALRLSQRRMMQMLEALDDGLVCVNARDIVTFANTAVRQIFNMPITVGETALTDLLTRDLVQTLADNEEETASFGLEIDGQVWNVHMFEMLPDAGAGRAVIISRTGQEQLVNTIRNAVDTTMPDIALPAPTSAPTPVLRSAYRALLVQAMTETLALWFVMTGCGKIEFAEKSGIWRVNLDKTSLQTRTLDKYLLIDTLPENPRWRDVVKSLNFILAQAEKAEPTPKTEAGIATLRQILENLREATPQS